MVSFSTDSGTTYPSIAKQEGLESVKDSFYSPWFLIGSKLIINIAQLGGEGIGLVQIH